MNLLKIFLAIAAVALAAYFFGLANGKEIKRAEYAQNIIESVRTANMARSALYNPDVVLRLREKYGRRFLPDIYSDPRGLCIGHKGNTASN